MITTSCTIKLHISRKKKKSAWNCELSETQVDCLFVHCIDIVLKKEDYKDESVSIRSMDPKVFIA
jgi:hypothetical protein